MVIYRFYDTFFDMETKNMPDGRFDHLAYCGFIGLAQSVELMYI